MKYYKLNINSLSDEQYKKIYNEVDLIRRKKCDLLKKSNDKKRCLAAYYLIVKTFLEEYNLKINNIDYSNDYPVLDIPYNISISHCDNWVVLAISRKKIGIDIEKIRPMNFDIMRYFCSDDDFNYIGTDLKKFFEVWTFKEAFFKANKKGISRESKKINFNDYSKTYDYFNNYIVCLYEETQE
ncbi:MAG: 4'-phosphopantetheinyl transferase superfamily protein [Bacilli bacterium]|nr:4'-phosphopantetheinyl transferase superfamily protein [Bacilli bacterium]